MADDQVKYSDLISDDVAKGIGMLDEALKSLRETLLSLKTEATGMGASLKGMGTATREQQQATAQQAASVENLSKRVRGLTEEESRLVAVRKQYKKLTDEQISRVDRLANALGKMNAADQSTIDHAMALISTINIENQSYNELQATYNALKDSLNAMTVAERQNTDAGKAMTTTAMNIRDKMNELQKATGNYTLQVGKYRAAFDGLGYSFQQILREAPSALNLNQFFLAISNNIPMFLDQLKAFKNEQAEIKANLATMTKGTAEYAEQLGKVETVGKKLGKVLVSWQSLVLVGLLILRNFDRIVAGISNLFNKVTKEQKMLNAVNEGAASTVGELTAKYKALQQEWRSIKAEDQGEWLKQHKNDWQELGYSIDDAKKAEDFYVNNTAAVQKAIDDRARSMAAMKLAAEKYEEVFKLQVKAEKAAATMRSMEEAGTAYEYRKERTRYIGNAATGSVTTITTPAGNYKTGAYAQAGIEYEMYKRQYEEVKKDAEDFLKFVKPDPNKGGGGNNNKEPKDQVADLLTLTRQLEDQIIANIENEYKRLDEEETKRHERFIQDQEAELAKLAENDPRRAVINQMIEEENRTHERKMEEIDEKRYQNLQALTQKRLADEKKAAEEEEKQEKENAKGKLKAAVDGWAQYKAKMVEEGKTRKQIVEAEVAAEIARLKLMQDLNRDVNGEIMSDEQKAKVQEWINLLERLQQTGNYGDYKPGQFMGKGGANVTNERKNYANIWEMLGIDMDNNQVSALNSVFDQAKEALNSWMDARKAAADQAKELADDEVSAAENALNREIELRNQGYANDVALKERELAEAKKLQKEAAQEQAKIAKEQILLDAALQASSMITASANIIKQFPNPAIWLPMLGVMWGAFSYAKVKAYQSAAKNIRFREGGVMLLEGGSHESGHDVPLGVGPAGSNLRAEGGEYFAVFNRRSSRRYGGRIPEVVNAINRGVFEERYIKTSDAIGAMAAVAGGRAENGSAVDLGAIESGVSELVKQGERAWSTEGEYRVMRYKNLTRRVKLN